jgi:hypothetical protein
MTKIAQFREHIVGLLFGFFADFSLTANWRIVRCPQVWFRPQLM